MRDALGTTVTLLVNVPTAAADAANLPADKRTAGAIVKLRSDDAADLVSSGLARFGGGPAGVGTMGAPRVTVDQVFADPRFQGKADVQKVAAVVSAGGPAVVGKHNPVHASGGPVTLTLPTGLGEGAVLSVEKVDSSVNAVTLTGSLRGVGSQSITLLWAHEALTLRTDSTGSWWPISGHKTKTTLDAAYGAPSALAMTRLRAAAMGDSTTAGDLRSVDQVPVLVGNTWAPMDAEIQQAGPRSWFTHACLLSGGRLVNHYNAGIGSDTTTGMVARFAADIVARKPDVVFLGDAHNDFSTGSGIAEATTRANIDTMVQAARSAGIMPILRTIYPDNNNAVYGAPIRRHNAWLKKYAAANRLLLVDLYSAVVDPASTTGAWQSAYQLDGTHASYSGAVVAGQKVLAQLDRLLRGGPDWLPSDNVTGGPNLLANPLMLTASGTSGLAANWVQTGTTTPSLATDPAVLGQAQSIAVTATGAAKVYQDVAINGTNIKGGNRVKWAGMVKVTAAAGSMNWSLDLSFPGFGSYIVRPMDRVTGLDYPWAYFECEAVVPAGATIARLGAYAYSGTGSLTLAQQGLYNLTTA